MSIKGAAAVLAMAFPLMASAQGNDVAYCMALGEAYETYTANMTRGRSVMPEPADARIAMEQCKTGNTAAAIPVLEQKLKNARVTLPPRG